MSSPKEPYWMEDWMPVKALVRIATGEGPPLAAHEAEAILSDHGDMLGMVGGYAMRAERAERRVGVLAERGEKLAQELEAAQLRSIEARNPGIDLDEVRAIRAASHSSPSGVPTRPHDALLGPDLS